MYIAHKDQTLKEHLEGVARLSRKNAEKIGCGDYGELLGLLHDLGKYSKSFQDYIKSATGIFDPDIDEEFVEAAELKGKIDHSTAGAQFVWTRFSAGLVSERLLAQILALCLVSHHSGMIDCLTTDLSGTYDAFTRRITKNDKKTHLKEVESKAREEVATRLNLILSKPEITKPMETLLKDILAAVPEKRQQATVFQFQVGLYVRFLFSCLIDADRQDSADSEKPKSAQKRQYGLYQPWLILSKKLEMAISGFGIPTTKVNKIRAEVSEQCLLASKKDKGIYTLTVPTGGGKTLASLRFALHHAEQHQLDRIVYIIPFTTIIDQNAEVVRGILETNNEEKGRIVLEHHSNISSERQTWKEKLLTESWDAPVVYTTMVQFLEACFGGGTRGARRMHQLARSVLVFDEIQTLPVRCVHMFCNAINFLVNQCGSSVVLCTATQPLLGEVDRLKGALALTPGNEIVADVQELYRGLKRVDVLDFRKLRGWTNDEIAKLAALEVEKTGSCLIIVNMKKSARSLFATIQTKTRAECFHLSTSMCPVHRKKVLDTIRERIKPERNLPTICISTQLIEAGVDVDFGSVIRYNAGLDSIAQAAGRCNRNGTRDKGTVYIVNPAEEKIDCLKDIVIGKDKTEKVLSDFEGNPEHYKNDRIGPDLLAWYYRNYFFERKNDMEYPVSSRENGWDDTLLSLLSHNSLSIQEYKRTHNNEFPLLDIRQSFMTAGKLFKSIDAPTQGIIVQYGEVGKSLVSQLSAAFEVEKEYRLLHDAQQYSVNLFPHEFERLKEAGAVFPLQKGANIYYLDQKYYSEQFGISTESINKEEFLNV